MQTPSVSALVTLLIAVSVLVGGIAMFWRTSGDLFLVFLVTHCADVAGGTVVLGQTVLRSRVGCKVSL